MDMVVQISVKVEQGDALGHDAQLFSFGFLLVALHLMISFSEFSSVGQRFGLSVCGLVSCGLSIVSMKGICRMIGLPFNSLDQLVMIILLGIGVDDMFVVVQTVKSKKPNEQTER